MKDPLQTEPTPQEILGLKPEGLSKEAVDKAYVAALAKRVPANKAKAARDALCNPVDRAWFRVQEYKPAALEGLVPNAAQDSTALNLDRRGATASAWEGIFKANYPAGDGAAHCLALLFYWWALAQEQQLAQAVEKQGIKRVPVPAGLFEAWRGAIAYWAMLLETPEFWRNGIGIASTEETAVKQRLKEALQNRFADQAQALSGHSGIVAEYRKLQASLAAEWESAHAVAKYGAKTPKGTIRAGLLGLERLGYLEKFRQLVEERYRQHPHDENTIKIRGFLSPYLAIDTLIRTNKPEEALTAIDRLSTTKQQSVEVCELRARALLLQGKHRAEVGKTQEALESWQTALGIRSLPQQLRNQIASEVVSACHSRATALQGKQPDEAIALLELGLELVPADQKLGETLAELLRRRAAIACNAEQPKVLDAQKRGKAPGSAAIRDAIPIIERAVADLTRAVELGSARARQDLEAASGFLEALRHGTVGHSLEGGGLPREAIEAQQAAKSQDWAKAIALLRELLSQRQFTDNAEVKTFLANCLVNHAVAQINEAIEKFNADVKERDNLPDKLATNHRNNRYRGGTRCAKCGKTPEEVRESWAWLSDAARIEEKTSWYRISLPGAEDLPLCGGCKADVSGRVYPDTQLLVAARKELQEALVLDPSSDYAKSQLDQLNQLTRKLDVDLDEMEKLWASLDKKASRLSKLWDKFRSGISTAIFYVLFWSAWIFVAWLVGMIFKVDLGTAWFIVYVGGVVLSWLVDRVRRR